MRAICIVGYKNSGKTTVILNLLSTLKKQGLKASVLKFSHHSFDRSDRDTGKFLTDAEQVLGVAKEQTQITWPVQKSWEHIIQAVENDILIIEGGRHLNFLPRIIVNRQKDADLAELDNGLVLGVYPMAGLDVSGPVLRTPEDLMKIILEKAFFLPGRDCGKCNSGNCHSMAKAIIDGQQRPSDCVFYPQKGLNITVNGQKLHLNPFVTDIIAGSILGMLNHLKGFTKGKISIELEDMD